MMMELMDDSIETIESDVEERQLHPLLNHVILRTIAEYISPKDRVAARSVCKLWHEEFTKKIVINFRSKKEIINFHKYNNENLKDDNRNLGNYFTKFSLVKLPLKNVSPLDFNSMINQLTEVANVRELYLPLLSTKAYSKILLKLISPTVELLSVELPFDPENIEGIYTLEEAPVILENIKTLVIKAHVEVLLDIKIFRDILTSCIKVKTIHISTNIMIPSTLLNWICENKPNLDLITFRTSVLSTNECNCIKMIHVMNEGYVKEIMIGQYILTKENISDYFHILAVYDGNKFVELSKKAKLYAGKQINNFTFISNQEFRYGVPIKNLLFHFPNLRNLYFEESNKSSFVTDVGIDDKVFPAMDGFFLNAMSNLNLGPLSDKISEIFPNLTSLTLIVKTELDLEPIYQKLGKLKHFNLTCMKKNIVGDEDLIGIPKKFISIMSLFGTFDFEILNELKNGIDFKLKPSIGLLKELEELHLYNEYDAIDNPDSKKLTKLSFYFGFRLLPKLKELDVRFPSITKIPEGHWNLIENDFLKLEKLRLPSTLPKYEVFRRLKSTRPNLQLQIW